MNRSRKILRVVKIFAFNLFDYICDLFDYRSLACLTCFLLLLNFLSLLSFWAHVSVVAVKLTVKAHYTFILGVIFLVFV